MLQQRERLIEKFGREPGPDDAVFFDPDADTPQPLDLERYEKDLADAMAAGRLPFADERQEAVLCGTADEEPEPVTAQRAGLPMELEWIIGNALAKDRDDRPSAAEEIARDLRTLGEKLKRELKRVSLDGGDPITLCELPVSGPHAHLPTQHCEHKR